MSTVAWEKTGKRQVVRAETGLALPVEHVGVVPVTKGLVSLTPSAPTSATVGITSSVVVAANANRTGLTLTNVSTARISLAFGNTAVLDNGVTLFAQASFSVDEFDFYTGSVSAIASLIGSQLAIQEYS